MKIIIIPSYSIRHHNAKAMMNQLTHPFSHQGRLRRYPIFFIKGRIYQQSHPLGWQNNQKRRKYLIFISNRKSIILKRGVYIEIGINWSALIFGKGSVYRTLPILIITIYRISQIPIWYIEVTYSFTMYDSPQDYTTYLIQDSTFPWGH